MMEFAEPWMQYMFIVLLLTVLVQLLNYYMSYRRLAFYKASPEPEGVQGVSIVICARNEKVNLEKNLPAILDQVYPELEVIVVNDCSWDSSGELLEEFARNYPRLKVVTLVEQEKYKHGKKFALTIGIKAAKYDLLLLTDADCMPQSRNWCSSFQHHFSDGTEIVLGYGAYKKESGLLNKLIRFDTMIIAMQYLSSAIAGNAYMGVGRNMAYRKSLFFRNKGFASHNHLLSGDDDLFVNQNANKTNVKIEINQDAFTLSEPRKTFSGWFDQKVRHMSTSSHYKFAHKLMLFTASSSTLFFYLLSAALIIAGYDWRIILSLYGLVLLLKLPVLWKVSHKLNEKDLFWLFPLLEPVLYIIQPFFYITNLFTKQKAWK
ncbi:MAG: glycosyltransferase [Bacteroidetes bacterium]|nr:MAG: glycosyltransferase [Bacteroidota bacterium]REK07580.1 MAG: glycosyltransferase [Bacteroidota bacterium]REK36987.1 MAG: glycosyltransferase [Bacteroidota bacterium]REK47808.1 MAG: glycosyltransferase [Bacteroidota bacterium]